MHSSITDGAQQYFNPFGCQRTSQTPQLLSSSGMCLYCRIVSSCKSVCGVFFFWLNFFILSRMIKFAQRKTKVYIQELPKTFQRFVYFLPQLIERTHRLNTGCSRVWLRVCKSFGILFWRRTLFFFFFFNTSISTKCGHLRDNKNTYGLQNPSGPKVWEIKFWSHSKGSCAVWSNKKSVQMCAFEQKKCVALI